MSQNRNAACQYERRCNQPSVGIIPMPEGAKRESIAVCRECFAEAQSLGFFVAYYGENEANAAHRCDAHVNRRHVEAIGRRVNARTRSSGVTFDRLAAALVAETEYVVTADNPRPPREPSRQRPALGRILDAYDAVNAGGYTGESEVTR